jgi:hypothetical protein
MLSYPIAACEGEPSAQGERKAREGIGTAPYLLRMGDRPGQFLDYVSRHGDALELWCLLQQHAG